MGIVFYFKGTFGVNNRAINGLTLFRGKKLRDAYSTPRILSAPSEGFIITGCLYVYFIREKRVDLLYFNVSMCAVSFRGVYFCDVGQGMLNLEIVSRCRHLF